MMQALKGIRHLTSSALKQAVSELSIPVPWGEIRGKVWGPEHGRPVLCLHGWADNCGTFNTLIPLLPQGNHTVNIMGECRFTAELDDSHVDVFFVLSQSTLSGGNVYNHGACTCFLQFSALYPEMVDAVVLLDSYGFLPTDPQEVPKVMREGIDGLIKFEKSSEEKKDRVYTYEKAVERLSAANPTLSEQSVHILLERGLHEVEGGVIFSRDFRINLKNIVRISLEQSLEMQARIQASVLVLLAEDGFEKIFTQADQKKYTSALLQGYRDKNHTVVMVPGNHHVHLNNPEAVAPLVSDFLRTKVLSKTSGVERPEISQGQKTLHHWK
uniref:Serine hydrolase like n=1 Tax=Sphaeramia orbicularis TaxID=375764 RepID=A0A672YCG6_9TELE